MNFIKILSSEIYRINFIKNSKRFYSLFTKREQLNEKFRVELAAAYRSLDNYGMNEGICNHLSAIVPSSKIEKDVMLIIPFGLHWKEVTPSKLIEIDEKNEVVAGEGRPELSALCIHRGIYDKRPDIKSIMHTHIPHATALTCLKEPELKMLHQNSARFYNRIAYDDAYGGLGEILEEGHRLGDVLGTKDVLFMGHHGVVVAANSISIAFDNMYYLERAAMIQVLALSTNKMIRELNQNTLNLTSKQIWESLPEYADSHLKSVIRMLSKTSEEFKIC